LVSFRDRLNRVGPALNVAGELWWIDREGDSRSADFVPTTIGSGEETALRLEVGANVEFWSTAVGYMTYEDIEREEWQTHFEYINAPEGVFITIKVVDTTEFLGRPQYPPRDWIQPDGQPHP
jgi:hypothetical protein